ncbi:MAG: DUF896 domain-containing protein [Lactobacillus sp.]|jgi:uncharacterized protein YnzC (UPF0291/DUF896 family)|uniref:UPF0291 protein ACFQ41_07625 n=1 Tax=Lacticaseibacillus suilingensis TaxID=2799577 RepID=A0ABW4BHK5_9LACO|nr:MULTISPECIES: DUF896 domain-containing protein [Lacticaseibacillus]MCI1895188.1 DUF896 domain-containing protein [Lactobacillus sp.]MCI1918136.1 DUF896 domain-containing protein [Lactobacillus sp.]MCI1940732.1 DUF896 domain-containing protein [Lactobacillus sp.]MCI1971418.1 DUF896 domain-containing protein [Lactobacillus sp.]MCI2016495.1 DUF896 domain-containing protein [Lactobacillus sp.]
MAQQPQARLDRINELAHKAKAEGLTAAEEAERKELRAAYIKDFRAGFAQQLETTQFFDKQGHEVTPKKIRDLQKKHGLRQD